MGTTRSIITKTATVLAGGITVLSMSACGLQISFGETGGSDDSSTDTDRRDDENTRQDTGTPETHDQNRDSDTSGGSGSSSGSGSGSGSGTGAGDSGSGTGSSGSGSGTGSGGSGSGGNSGSGSYSGGSHRVPGHVLAADIKQVAEADLGISGITVDCNDLHARSVGSTTTCTMDVPGDKKYFPLAKVTKIEGNHVTYDLEFPGVDF